MEGLLKWSIDAAHSGKVESNPDPKMLSQLLGAPDDYTMMREELRAAVESKEKQERIECLEAFEEHVENVDNADNIGKLWEPLLFLAKDEDADIRALAFSCIAAAVQNNNKTQLDLVATKSGIQLIVDHINDPNESVSSKALFALSSAITHCQPAYDQFVASRGWDFLNQVFTTNFETGDDRPDKIRSKVLSLLMAVILHAPHNPVHSELEKRGIIAKLENLEPAETGIVKEKIERILQTLKDSPKHETKLLTQA